MIYQAITSNAGGGEEALPESETTPLAPGAPNTGSMIYRAAGMPVLVAIVVVLGSAAVGTSVLAYRAARR